VHVRSGLAKSPNETMKQDVIQASVQCPSTEGIPF